jgi:hypothetical protein
MAERVYHVTCTYARARGTFVANVRGQRALKATCRHGELGAVVALASKLANLMHAKRTEGSPLGDPPFSIQTMDSGNGPATHSITMEI